MASLLDYGSDAEDVVLPKWRFQYVDGSRFSRPCCLISLVSFGYLAYQGELLLLSLPLPSQGGDIGRRQYIR